MSRFSIVMKREKLCINLFENYAIRIGALFNHAVLQIKENSWCQS